MKSETYVQPEKRRGPGRPRGFDREAALHEAMLLFWKQGFDGTSYTDLTKATGMSKPTLYANFGDKVELFRRAMVAYAEQATTVYEEALNQPTSRESVEACLRLARGLNAQADEPKVCFLVQGALTGSADTQELRDDPHLPWNDTITVTRRYDAESPLGKLVDRHQERHRIRIPSCHWRLDKTWRDCHDPNRTAQQLDAQALGHRDDR